MPFTLSLLAASGFALMITGCPDSGSTKAKVVASGDVKVNVGGLKIEVDDS